MLERVIFFVGCCGGGGGGGVFSVRIMCTFSRRGIVLYFQQCVELNGNAIKKH